MSEASETEFSVVAEHIPAPVEGPVSAGKVIHGRLIPAQQQMLLFSAEEWEEFIEEWAHYQKTLPEQQTWESMSPGLLMSPVSRGFGKLQQTVDQLNDEARDFERLTPKMGEQLELALGELSDLNPSLSALRAAYTELMDRRSSVQNSLNILASISQLEDHRAELEPTREALSPEEPPSPELSLSTLNTFSRIYEEILRSWNFPELEGVYFDGVSRDLVISGKPRGARGKGMRALTHAAFSVALLEFTRRNELPHPGFVVLDTPLLAYREPEGDEGDLTGTDVHERFYETLDQYKDRQVLENVDPPKNVRDSDQSTFFSKNPHKGRYGFFPPVH